MALSDDKLRRLLTAIENDKLTFLCGAGLSIPQPSDLPTAAKVAEACYDKRQPIEALDPLLRTDIDKLAGLFHGRKEFVETFIPLVPWNDLMGEPNRGHAAVADFLICRAVHGVLSANFDTMIERWGGNLKVALNGALDGQEATNFMSVANPLLKFHGCMTRGPEKTLWTQGQLSEAEVQARIESCSQWMTQHLPGRHLVVIGFWTDWGYLNSVLAKSFKIENALSVTVVDLSSSADLQKKAPDLWGKLNALSKDFEHIQASGADILEQLRLAFSQAWARKFYALGKPLADKQGITTVPKPDAISLDGLYDLRRDAEGKPYTRAASLKEPPLSAGEASLAHIRLIHDGAAQNEAWLKHKGKSVRVLNGAASGKDVESIRQGHREPPTLPQPDIVICAGAVDLVVPARLIATGKGSSVVKPSPGGGAEWLTLNEALGVFGA
jgi:hypothetical protein